MSHSLLRIDFGNNRTTIFLQTQTRGHSVKKFLLFLFCCSVCFCSLAQSESDTLPPKQDSPVVKKRDSAAISRQDSARIKDTTVKKIRPSRDTTRDITRDTTRRIEAIQPDTPLRPNAIPARPDTPDPKPETLRVDLKIAGDLLPGYTPDTLQNLSRIALFQSVLREHPYYNFFGEPIAMTVQEKKSNGSEGMFYFLAGLLLYFGFIRLIFGKYIENLISLFFRVTMRQQQIRDQLLQSPLPSLFLNLLYFITGGFFLSLVVTHYNIVPAMSKWILFAWCAGLLMVIYLGKFITLKLTGWIFDVSDATDTYIFIVFLVNKMIGIFLLPVLVVMAFAGPGLFEVKMTLAFFVLVILFIYRFIISYKPIRNEIKLNRFHFFIYLCAFEIAPLLLIYKVLLIFVERVY